MRGNRLLTLRGGGENGDYTDDNDGNIDDDNDDEDGEPDKNRMVDEEQPFALRGGRDSRINKRTKKKKLMKAETSRMNEQKWETMLANVGLRPQDQPDLEYLSSSSDTSDDSSSAVG